MRSPATGAVGIAQRCARAGCGYQLADRPRGARPADRPTGPAAARFLGEGLPPTCSSRFLVAGESPPPPSRKRTPVCRVAPSATPVSSLGPHAGGAWKTGVERGIAAAAVGARGSILFSTPRVRQATSGAGHRLAVVAVRGPWTSAWGRGPDPRPVDPGHRVGSLTRARGPRVGDVPSRRCSRCRRSRHVRGPRDGTGPEARSRRPVAGRTSRSAERSRELPSYSTGPRSWGYVLLPVGHPLLVVVRRPHENPVQRLVLGEHHVEPRQPGSPRGWALGPGPGTPVPGLGRSRIAWVCCHPNASRNQLSSSAVVGGRRSGRAALLDPARGRQRVPGRASSDSSTACRLTRSRRCSPHAELRLVLRAYPTPGRRRARPLRRRCGRRTRHRARRAPPGHRKRSSDSSPVRRCRAASTSAAPSTCSSEDDLGDPPVRAMPSGHMSFRRVNRLWHPDGSYGVQARQPATG